MQSRFQIIKIFVYFWKSDLTWPEKYDIDAQFSYIGVVWAVTVVHVSHSHEVLNNEQINAAIVLLLLLLTK